MKKILILCLILLGGLFLFAFQNNKTNRDVVQFASWGSESEINILKPILKDFEEQNPDIKVDFMHIPQNYFQKIHLLFASNTAPDVLFMNNQYLPVYANAGVLEDLSNEFEFDKFYTNSVDALKWQGKIYGVPRDISNTVIFYNKDLFRRYNVSEPEQDWDLDDLLNKAQKLTDLPENFGVSFEETPLLYLPYMTTCGGWTNSDTNDYFEQNVLSRENNRKSLNFYADLRNKYHVAPKKEESASATMAQMFLQGRLAMQVSGRWLVPKYRQEAKFDWDVVQFPSCKKGEKSIVPMDASGWVISKSSHNKQAAIKLVRFLASKESISKFTKDGLIVPARIDVANSPVFLDSNKPKNSKVFLDVAQNSKPTPVTLNYREILDDLKSKNEYLFNK